MSDSTQDLNAAVSDVGGLRALPDGTAYSDNSPKASPPSKSRRQESPIQEAQPKAWPTPPSLFAASSNAIDASVDESNLGPSSARPYGPAREYTEGSLNQIRTALPINSLRSDAISPDDRCNANTQQPSQEDQQPSAPLPISDGTERTDMAVDSSSSYETQEAEIQDATITVRKTKHTVHRKSKTGKRGFSSGSNAKLQTFSMRGQKPPRLPAVADASQSSVHDEQAEYTRRQFENGQS